MASQQTPLSGYFIKNIGQNRGRPRIWLQAQEVSSAGLQAGDKYEVHVKGGTIILRANPDGSRVVSHKPAKNAGDQPIPIIDINSEALLALFEGMSAIRLVQMKGEIYLMPVATEIRKKERVARLRTKMKLGIPLSVGSLSHGGGFASHALHSGMHEAGVNTELAFANDIRPELLQHASNNNEIWTAKTIPLGAPLQELAMDQSAVNRIPRTDIVEMGLPCSGASVAGRARRGTAMPEEHPDVGHLVVSALIILARANPAIIWFENVVPYASSASAAILRNQLRDMGYVTHETVVDGSDYNAMEGRKRWFMVAVTEGMHFDWSMIQKPEKKDVILSDLYDDIPQDSPLWSEMKGLKLKQERDIAAGKSFLMQIYDGDATKIGTITKGYAKVRSTDPKIAHPTNPDLLRQLTPAEHSRVKQQPIHLIANVSATLAHEMLGQSGTREVVVATGRLIGETVLEFIGDVKPHSRQDLIDAIELELASSISSVVDEIKAPMANVVYEGPILVNELGATVQSIGNGVGILHSTSALEHVRLGEVMRVCYPNKRDQPQIQHMSEAAPAITQSLAAELQQQAQSLSAERSPHTQQFSTPPQNSFDFDSPEPTSQRPFPRMGM